MLYEIWLSGLDMSYLIAEGYIIRCASEITEGFLAELEELYGALTIEPSEGQYAQRASYL